METVIVLRFMERLTAVLFGGLLVWLGYRLFLEIPTKSNSAGEFTLPGGTAIHITRVGPGVFFSLFGTAILIMSYMHPVDFKQGPSAGSGSSTAGAAGGENASFIGAMPALSSPAEKVSLRSDRKVDFEMLNRMPADLRADLSPAVRNDYVSAAMRIKLIMMEGVWGEDWGNFEVFRKWVMTGDETVPPELSKPCAYFTGRP
jgi:hypothetical protein